MDPNHQNSGGMMGITSIWDIIVLVIVSRLFGFGMDGQQGNNASTVDPQTAMLMAQSNTAMLMAQSNTANIESQIDRAIRSAQDTQNAQNSMAAIAAKLNECCCQNLLGQKDIMNGQTTIADGIAKAASDIISNQNLVALQTENRELSRNLSLAENALNNCQQTAAFTAAINGAVTPLAQAVSSIQAQLNCGVKAYPYTASVPADLPPIMQASVCR